MLFGIVMLPANRTRRHLFFGLMNLGLFCWSLSYFLGYVSPSLFPADRILFMGEVFFFVGQAGVALVTTYWFLLAAETVGNRAWAGGSRLLIAHVPGAALILAVATNPFHHLFMTRDDASPLGSFTYGPVAVPLLVLSWALVLAATVLYVRAALRPDTTHRRMAVLLAFAGVVPLLGNVLWMTRGLTGLSLPYNPTVVLLALSGVLIAVAVFKAGLVDIVPLAEGQAFHSMNDAAIVLSPDWRILALNPAAERIVPAAAIGRTLADVVAALGADPALPGLDAPGGRPELILGGTTYWVRLEPMRGPRGRSVGELLLLTDVSEKRAFEERILELNAELRRTVETLESAPVD